MERLIEEMEKVLEREVAAVNAKQAESNDSRVFVPEPMSVSFVALPGTLRKAVDVVHGRNGKRYLVRLIYEQNGERWVKRVPCGPEAVRTDTWRKLIYPR